MRKVQVIVYARVSERCPTLSFIVVGWPELFKDDAFVIGQSTISIEHREWDPARGLLTLLYPVARQIFNDLTRRKDVRKTDDFSFEMSDQVWSE